MLKNAEYISFDFNIDRVHKYIINNPELKNKKIILNGNYKIDLELMSQVNSIFHGNTSNLYFNMPGNMLFVSYEDCKKTLIEIENVATKVESFDFSPLEQIMYVFDLVRDCIYNEEGESEEKYKSRDLTSVILGDKIVCGGFSNKFDALLKRLGFKSRFYALDGIIGEGHARNIVYISDDKYNINGVYYFDTTWNSKKSENDNTYLLSYKYFAKTKSEIDKFNQGLLVDKTFPYFSHDIMWEFEDICENKGISSIPTKYLKSVNFMSNMINGTNLVHPLAIILGASFKDSINTKELTKKIGELTEYFDTPITADILLKALYNVRKNQYYLDPYKFPFTLDDFYKTVIYSDWKFEESNEEKILNCIFGKEVNSKNQKRKMINYCIKCGLSKDIQRVKLTKVLRKIYDNNNNK